MISTDYTLETIGTHSFPERFQQMAHMHQQEIRDGFLTSLGERFLTRLYRSLAEEANVFTIAAVAGHQMIGFLCASESTSAVYRRILARHAWRLAPQLIHRIVSPTTMRRVAETVLYPSRTDRMKLPAPEILNFCVDSRYQRCGVGRRLFFALHDEFRQRGIPSIRIVTGAAQVSAQRFYESIGAQRVGDISVHRDVPSIVYVYDFIASGATAA